MAINEDLENDVKNIFREPWKVESTETVPVPEDIRLKSNHAKELSWAVVLYADLDGSTNLVDTKTPAFSSEIYKSYLYCAGQLIKHRGGKITAYDGDRIMGIFLGESKHTDAVTCAFNINHAVQNIINPALKHQYQKTSYEVKHVIGIDASQIQATRTGVPVYNDIVWVGSAANHAAKLSALPSTHAIRITEIVYQKMLDSAKCRLDGSLGIWEQINWTPMNKTIYRTNYWRKP